jgi:FkbM family methyltransferase
LTRRHPLLKSIQATVGIFGVHLARKINMPFGVDKITDIAALCPKPRVIFDVGANVGQTVDELRSTFAEASIYSFEPVPSTFEALLANTRRYRGVECIPCALGEMAGSASITDSSTSGQNTLNTSAKPGSPTVDVKVDTIDAFCKARGIEVIDVLKIDTEGFEMSVLRGARGMLKQGSIGFVLAECEFTPNPAEPHGDFFEIAPFLLGLGYRLVAFYSGGVDGDGWRWGDVLFMRPAGVRPVVCSPYVLIGTGSS